MKRIGRALFVLMSCMSLPAFSCDYCIASHGISPVELGSTGIRYDLRLLHIGNVYNGSTEMPNTSGVEENFQTHQFSFHYRTGDKLTFSLLVPISFRTTSRNAVTPTGIAMRGSQTPQHAGKQHSAASSDAISGLIDIVALAKYRLLDETADDHPFTLVISGGLKLPTGKSDARDASGGLLNPHLQLGSGSTDAIAGLCLVKNVDDISLVASFTGVLPSQGANGYRYGNNLNYDLGMRYRFLEAEEGVAGSLFGAVSLLGEWHGRESQNGIVLDETGGNTTYFSPGLLYFLTDKISLETSYQHAIMHQVNGTQLGESYRIVAGAQYLF